MEEEGDFIIQNL